MNLITKRLYLIHEKKNAKLICKNPHGYEINRDFDLISKKVRNHQSLLRNQVTVI